MAIKKLIKCDKCNEEFYNKDKKCPNCGNTNREKKSNILIFFLKMVVLFFIVDIFTTFIPVLIGNSLLNYKYGEDFIIEALWCLCIILILLMSGNLYVFTEKKMKFKKAVKLGISMLLFSLLSLLASFASIDKINILKLLNLILFCSAIGLAEELLCRGWIQNEFIERYGKDRKHVIISIVLSSLVFGAMHITNILAGQGVVETIMQIIQATSLGVLLGSIYYRSKNIWAVAFLHGFYDFAILLSDINTIKDCTTGSVSNAMFIYHLVFSILIVAFYILSSIVVMNKKDTNKIIDENSELTDEEIKKDKKITNVAISLTVIIFAIFIFPFDFELDGEDEYQVCYSYEEINIDGYETHFSHYDIYDISYNEDVKYNQNAENETNDRNIENTENNEKKQYKYYLYFDIDEYKLVIENQSTEEKVYIDNDNISNFIGLYNYDDYIIMYYDSSNEKVYYSKINLNILADEKQFFENINSSFKAYDVPEIRTFGYLTTGDGNYAYPYMVSNLGDEFIIDKEGNLLLLR